MKMIYRKHFPERLKKAVAVTTLSLVGLQPAAAFAETSAVQVTAGEAVSVSATGSAVPSTGAVQNAALPTAKITKEQAVEIVKKLFPQFEKFTVSNVQLGDHSTYPPQYQNVWSIQWEYTVGNNSYGFSSKVDSMTGDLLSTSIYQPIPGKNETYYPPKLTEEEALAVAKEFIKKASPSIPESAIRKSDTVFVHAPQPLFGPVLYSFSFAIDVNGVRSPSDILYITVDGNGQVTGYNRSVSGDVYPSGTPALSAEEASKIYEASVDYTLQYMPVYKTSYRDKKWILGWTPRRMGEANVDAQTGDLLDEMGNKADTQSAPYADVEKMSAVFTPVLGSDHGQLTADQAVQAVEQRMQIPQDRKPSYQTLRSDGPYSFGSGKKVWDLNWTEQPQKPQPFPSSTHASVDAMTGQILEYRQNAFGPPWTQSENQHETTSRITNEEARNKATEYINILYPDAANELKLITASTNPKQGDSSFDFQFQRFYKGIPVGGESASLSLDASGKLTSYYANRTDDLDTALGKLEAKLTLEDAKAKYLTDTTEQLQYKRFGGYYLASNGNFQPVSIKLVYARVNRNPNQNGFVLNAASGEWTPSFTGTESPASGSDPIPQDIAKHWARKELATLLKYGVIKADDADLIHPDEALTFGDWMNMMKQAVNPNFEPQAPYRADVKVAGFSDVDAASPYYAASQLYIQNRWLNPETTPELHPEQPLTREALAVNLIHVIKYDKLASVLERNAAESFLDRSEISDAERGAVSLAVQLGLLTATADNRFDPQHRVTKAEAAAVLMRLVTLQGKLDQVIVN
ncbi:hypothetical protein SD70_28425 [Gordoniibacillus kamchatkensis]|uniref:SLH domain-containing protein n=1 Tax=Gordoniibacillus kamchatkensis TaxID=1590651 RepID=A0ABR5ABA9_9BACL|nr:S-layer homology domain-containing protein [Paenibacillus sp. VKM B-2647]KIL38123.1 hypothetical protein SD70_28425 [Paenibacillus sp. VKM B-2647]